MADAFYSLGDHSELAVTAFDRVTELEFQSNLVFAQFAQRKAWNGNGTPEKGSAVTFTIHQSLNPITSDLPETTDPDAVNFGNNQISVSMAEKGGLVKLTSKIQLASWAKVDSLAPNVVGMNMGESFDIHARLAYDAQTGSDYVRYVGQSSKSAITTSNTMTLSEMDLGKAVLESRDVLGVNKSPDAQMSNNGNVQEYIAVMHPNVFHSLFTESGAGSLRDISKYANPKAFYRGERGDYNSMRILVTTNAEVDYNAGNNTATSDVDGAVAVAGTTLTVTSGTNFTGSGTVTITTSGSDYTYKVTAVATNDLTIDRCIDIDGVKQRNTTGSGFVVAHADTDAVVEGVDVYTTYVFGYQAVAFAYHAKPQLVLSEGLDYLQRISGIGWKGYYGFGKLRDLSLYKIYSATSTNIPTL